MTVTSREYAEALFELAAEKGKSSEYKEELESVCRLFSETPAYLDFLHSRAVSAKERTAALSRAFSGAVSEDVLSFLCILCEKGRIREITDCAAAYEELFLAVQGISRAQVISAEALSLQERDRLEKALEAKFRRKLKISYQVDNSLLGGVVVKCDGIVLDGSLKHRLSEVKGVMHGEHEAGRN